MQNLLQLKDLNYQYSDSNQFNLRSININLPNTKIACLLGKNGSGKTTIFRLIAGLEKITNGEIKLGNTLLSNRNFLLAPSRRHIAFVSQAQTLFPHLTIRKNLLFANESYAKLDILSHKYNILTLLNSYPNELSGGQKQLILLLRVFLQNPKLVILDEAFQFLDKKTKFLIYDELKQFQIEKRIPIFFSTHDINDALRLADTLIIVKHGKIIAHDFCEKILKNPKKPEIADYFGSLFYFDSFKEKNGILSSFCESTERKKFGVLVSHIEITNEKEALPSAKITAKYFHTLGFLYQIELASQKFNIVSKQDFTINLDIALLIRLHDILSFK